MLWETKTDTLQESAQRSMLSMPPAGNPRAMVFDFLTIIDCNASSVRLISKFQTLKNTTLTVTFLDQQPFHSGMQQPQKPRVKPPDVKLEQRRSKVSESVSAIIFMRSQKIVIYSCKIFLLSLYLTLTYLMCQHFKLYAVGAKQAACKFVIISLKCGRRK